MTYIHINRPKTTASCHLNDCPTCERPRRMLAEHAEWYGTIWTCLGCGDRWDGDGYRLERPFAPAWRGRQVQRARRVLASMGLQA